MNEKTKTMSAFLKNNQWFLMFMSVVFGIIATMLVHIYIRNKVLTVSGGGFVPVIDIVKDMNEGDIITEECISVRNIPASITHNKMVTDQYKDFVIGQKAGTRLFAGQALFWNDVSVEKPKTLPQKLKSNERAVSLFVDDATGLKGLLKPGDRVDVVGYFDIADEDYKNVRSVAKVVLQNITVLAVGSNMNPSIFYYPSGEGEKSNLQMPEASGQNIPNTVTLRVHANDVPMLIFAEKKGEIFLSLRSDGDIIVEPIPEVGYKELQKLESASISADVSRKEGYPAVYEEGQEKYNVAWPSDNFSKEELPPFIPQLKEQVQKVMDEKKQQAETKNNPQPDKK